MLPLGGEQVENIILYRKEGAEKKQIIETSSKTFDLSVKVQERMFKINLGS